MTCSLTLSIDNGLAKRAIRKASFDNIAVDQASNMRELRLPSFLGILERSSKMRQ